MNVIFVDCTDTGYLNESLDDDGTTRAIFKTRAAVKQTKKFAAQKKFTRKRKAKHTQDSSGCTDTII